MSSQMIGAIVVSVMLLGVAVLPRPTSLVVAISLSLYLIIRYRGERQ